MDRRTFLSSSLGAAAMGCMLPGLDCIAARNSSPARLLVLIDRAMPISRSYAALCQAADARYFDVGADIGLLWYETLRDWPGRIAGVLRPSDCFVLRSLSFAHGRNCYSTTLGPRAHGHAHDARAVALAIDAAPPVSRR
jgi:hypothetical protein